MAIVLTTEQELFCRYISMGYTKSNSVKYAGYSCEAAYSSIAKRLLGSSHIQSRIMELQTTMYDVDTVRKDIISWYKAYDLFELGSVVTPIPTIDKDNNPTVKYMVKRYDLWTPLEKALFKGIGKNGFPEFYDKVDAKKELCRIFGLYKENAISDEEDIDTIFSGAGVTPSVKSKASNNTKGALDEDDEDDEVLNAQLEALLNLEDNKVAEVKPKEGITTEEPVVDEYYEEPEYEIMQ